MIYMIDIFNKKKIYNLQNELTTVKNSINVKNNLASYQDMLSGYFSSFDGYGESYKYHINNNTIKSLFTLQRILIAQLIKSSGFVRRIIDLPIDNSFMDGYKIITKEGNTEDLKKIEKAIFGQDANGYSCYNTILSALKKSRAFGGAFIIIQNDKDLIEPIEYNESLYNTNVKFMCCDCWSSMSQTIKSNTQQNGEYIADWVDLHKQEMIDIQYLGTQYKVHTSRVIRVKELNDLDFYVPQLRGWGFSALESLLLPILGYMQLCKIIVEIAEENTKPILNIDFDATSSDEELKKWIEKLKQECNNSNYKNPLILMKGITFEQKQISTDNLHNLFEITLKRIAMETGLTTQELQGEGASGFSSGQDNMEIISQNKEKLRNERKGLFEIITQIKYYDVFGYIPSDLEIEFNFDRKPSAKEKQEQDNQFIQMLTNLKSNGIMTAEEIRNILIEKNIISADLLSSNFMELDINDEQEGFTTE